MKASSILSAALFLVTSSFSQGIIEHEQVPMESNDYITLREVLDSMGLEKIRVKDVATFNHDRIVNIDLSNKAKT